MYQVYYQFGFGNQPRTFVAEFETEKYAQVLVDCGNKLYDDGREFYIEEVEEVEEDTSTGYMKRVDVDDWKFVPYETRY